MFFLVNKWPGWKACLGVALASCSRSCWKRRHWWCLHHWINHPWGRLLGRTGSDQISAHFMWWTDVPRATAAAFQVNHSHIWTIGDHSVSKRVVWCLWLCIRHNNCALKGGNPLESGIQIPKPFSQTVQLLNVLIWLRLQLQNKAAVYVQHSSMTFWPKKHFTSPGF